jgi:hypothetical protein
MDDQSTAEAAVAAGEDDCRPRRKVSDGIRRVFGVLSAFKDVLDETIVETRHLENLSPE